MDERVRLFRSEVRRLGGVGRGRRYPRPLRDLAVTYCREAMGAGQALREIADDLQVTEATLQRWLDSASPATIAAPSFQEVVLADDGEVPRLAVVTPGGYRVEGLSLTDVTTLLRALR